MVPDTFKIIARVRFQAVSPPLSVHLIASIEAFPSTLDVYLLPRVV
jgi:hypothetical protein